MRNVIPVPHGNRARSFSLRIPASVKKHWLKIVIGLFFFCLTLPITWWLVRTAWASVSYTSGNKDAYSDFGVWGSADERERAEEKMKKRKEVLAKFDADLVRQKFTPKDWEPMANQVLCDKTNFPKRQESNPVPMRLNVALMEKPEIVVRMPAFPGMRSCWPEFWVVSGGKRVLANRVKTVIPPYKSRSMTNLSFVTTTRYPLPKPLDVHVKAVDLADNAYRARVAAYKILNPRMDWALRPKDPKKPNGKKEWQWVPVDTIASWGNIPAASEYKRQLYVRFAYADGADVAEAAMQKWPFLVGFQTGDGKTKTLRIHQPEKHLTALLPDDASAFSLAVPLQLGRKIRVEVIAAYEPKLD